MKLRFEHIAIFGCICVLSSCTIDKTENLNDHIITGRKDLLARVR